MCAFSPVFAQGMTVSVLEADALRDGIDESARRGTLDGFGRRFLRREAGLIAMPWRMASNEDFRYPATRGRKELGAGLLDRYVGRVHRASVRDLSVYRAYLQAMHMVRSPFALFDPRILVRVLARR